MPGMKEGGQTDERDASEASIPRVYLKGLNEIKSMYILDLELELVSFENCVYLYYPRFFE